MTRVIQMLTPFLDVGGRDGCAVVASSDVAPITSLTCKLQGLTPFYRILQTVLHVACSAHPDPDHVTDRCIELHSATAVTKGTVKILSQAYVDSDTHHISVCFHDFSTACVCSLQVLSSCILSPSIVMTPCIIKAQQPQTHLRVSESVMK